MFSGYNYDSIRDMEIHHTTHHRWQRPVIENPLTLYNKNNQKRLHSTINKIEETDISYQIKIIDDEFLDWFEPFYTEQMKSKVNAKIHDLHIATRPQEHIENYYQLTLFEGDSRLGAIVFSLRKDNMLGISFRALAHNWLENSLQANPALYTDYVLAEFAREKNMEIFSHGLDRNPYGLNANIGLATFKLTVGCTPKIPKETEFTKTDISQLDTDTLILLPPEEDIIIKNAILVCTTETEPKYAQLRAYSDRLAIEVKHRN